MEPIEARSDRQSLLIAATPQAVFAAIADPQRVERWWGPAGFRNTIHAFDFKPGGRWLLTMHGPDGKDYANESRFVRIEPDAGVEIEHLDGHHFFLKLELVPTAEGTRVQWCQTFDTAEHFQKLASFVKQANAENLQRLADEVARGAPQAAR